MGEFEIVPVTQLTVSDLLNIINSELNQVEYTAKSSEKIKTIMYTVLISLLDLCCHDELAFETVFYSNHTEESLVHMQELHYHIQITIERASILVSLVTIDYALYGSSVLKLAEHICGASSNLLQIITTIGNHQSYPKSEL